MGRPPTRPKKLRDGFYIDVRRKGDKSGIKIYRESRDKMIQAYEEFNKYKEVVILGEMKNGKWIDPPDIESSNS
jgi:hypothetical protein